MYTIEIVASEMQEGIFMCEEKIGTEHRNHDK